MPAVPGGLKHAPLGCVMAAPTQAPGSEQDAMPKSLRVTPVPSAVQSRRVEAMPGSRRELQAPAASVTRGELVPPQVVLRVKTDTATVRGAGGAPPQYALAKLRGGEGRWEGMWQTRGARLPTELAHARTHPSGMLL